MTARKAHTPWPVRSARVTLDNAITGNRRRAADRTDLAEATVMTSRSRPRRRPAFLVTSSIGVTACLLAAGCAPAARASAEEGAPTSAPSAAAQPPVVPSAPVPAAGAALPPTGSEAGKKHRVRMSVNTPKGKVGVGYLLTATFSDPVKRRGAAEKRMQVTVDGVVTAGAWSWRTSTTAMFRPRKGFWPANSRVALHSTLAGTVLARAGAKKGQLYVANARSTRTEAFRTARSFIAYITDSKHQMVVKKNGKKIRTIPVSMGKPGFTTRSGIKVATEKYYVKRMTNQGLGYDVQSPYSVRITPTGEYIHGAPWATGRIGRYNGSHGCTNLYVADAKWYYDHVMYGDPVVTTGTGRPMEWTNGMGGPWNVPWKAWLAESALKGQQAS